MFINDDMTAFNKEVFNYARAEMKDLPLSVWSSDEKVLVKQQSGREFKPKTMLTLLLLNNWDAGIHSLCS